MKVKVIEIKHLEKYLNKIKPYLKDIINNLTTSDKWKIKKKQQLILFLLKTIK